MRNAELARVFRDIAAYLDMNDVAFKPRAYEKAAQAIESHDRPLEAVYRAGGVKALREIPGIGASRSRARSAAARRPSATPTSSPLPAPPSARSPPSRSSPRWRASSARATPSAA